jgi:hypothetical protein
MMPYRPGSPSQPAIRDRKSFSANSWIGKDSKGKVRLNLRILGQIGAASAVILDACSAPVMLPELAGHAWPGAVLIGLAAAEDTDGRNSVMVLGDVLRELCYPRRERTLCQPSDVRKRPRAGGL